MAEIIATQCCIAGGGPAGLMAGLLLARAGVNVMVLEKHADFLRDFRGDTIHPSTLEVMHELGWLDEFLRLPHYAARSFRAVWGRQPMAVASFDHLPAHARFIAMMPQWDFLNFIAEKGRSFERFQLRRQMDAQALIMDGGRVAGLRAASPTGPVEIRADLVIAADGRGSELRDQSGLILDDLGAPMDLLWLRLTRKPSDSESIEVRVGHKHMLVLINRGDYWQCAYIIAKGQVELVRAQGLEAFRASLAAISGLDAARTADIQSWDQVKLLNVQVNRLRRWWREGFLCIGDAAHAMSPIAGVGVNLAVQDAVAVSNLLAAPLRSGTLTTRHLQNVQARREFPARMTQGMQVLMQNQVVKAALDGTGSLTPPLLLRMLDHAPRLRRITGRILGLGVRPEHIQT